MYVCAEPVEGFSEDFSVVPVGKYLIVFLLINKPDALIIPILFCYKNLHVSDIFSAHHQEFSTVHSALVSFMQVSDDRFQAESGLNSILMGREDARNM